MWLGGAAGPLAEGDFTAGRRGIGPLPGGAQSSSFFLLAPASKAPPPPGLASGSSGRSGRRQSLVSANKKLQQPHFNFCAIV